MPGYVQNKLCVLPVNLTIHEELRAARCLPRHNPLCDHCTIGCHWGDVVWRRGWPPQCGPYSWSPFLLLPWLSGDLTCRVSLIRGWVTHSNEVRIPRGVVMVRTSPPKLTLRYNGHCDGRGRWDLPEVTRSQGFHSWDGLVVLSQEWVCYSGGSFAIKVSSLAFTLPPRTPMRSFALGHVLTRHEDPHQRQPPFWASLPSLHNCDYCL